MMLRFCSIIISTGFLAFSAFADGPIFTNIPSTLPSQFNSSIGYEAQQVVQFGGILQPDFANGNYLTNATVVLDNYALESNYLDFGTQTGYHVNMTLTLYNVNNDGSVGSQIVTSGPINQSINWAPNANGDVQEVNFGFNNVALPSQFIWGLAFPTSYSTGGTDVGPENSLNLALTADPNITGGSQPGFYPATVGTDLAYSCGSGEPASQPSTNYCDTIYYADNSNSFGQLAPFALVNGTGVVEFDATSVAPTPEPATLGLIGLGLIGLSLARKKNRA